MYSQLPESQKVFMRVASLNRILRPSHWLLILIACSAAGLGGLGSPETLAHGQELRNAIRDYRDDRVFNYQASDPQYRGKIFNVHTGHYGKFYKCDAQKDKRNLPYICWKPHHEYDFPPCLGFCENLRREITEIKQRISDGAGACRSSSSCNQCQSPQCQQTSQPVYQSNCSCAQCVMSFNAPPNSLAAANENSNRGIAANSQVKAQPSCACPSCKLKANSNRASTGNPGSRYGLANRAASTYKKPVNPSSKVHRTSDQENYGLVSGKIFQPTAVATRNAVDQAELNQVKVPGLPLENTTPAALLSPERSALPQLKATTNSRSRASSVQPPRSNGPRVVERTEFWNQYKVF